MPTNALASILTNTLLSAGLAAQCGAEWLPMGGIPGVDARARRCTMWDPNGAGPSGLVPVFAGSFTVTGDVPAAGVAGWDPATGQWIAMGAFGDEATAITTLPNGELVAGRTAGGYGVDRWDGSSWVRLGPSFPSPVGDLLALPNGDVIACGSFQSIGGATVNGVARWDGASWSAMGAGLTRPVQTLAQLPNGDVVAAGGALLLGGVADFSVQRWTGAAWAPLGGAFDDDIFAMTVLPNGDLLVGGDFTQAGGIAANRLARWTGATWAPFAPVPGNDRVLDLVTLQSGDVLAATDGYGGVQRWNGASWTSLGNVTSLGGSRMVMCACEAPGGDVYVGGLFDEIAGAVASNVARLSGGGWSALGDGIDGDIAAFCEARNGDWYVGGTFTVVGGVPAARVARWDGASWSPLGLGATADVRAIVQLPDDTIVAGGSFEYAGGQFAYHVAQWNGLAWTPLGNGVAGDVLALAIGPNDELIAGTTSGAWRYVGGQWVAMGLTGQVKSLDVLPNGDVLASGAIAGGLRWWDGAAWSALPGLALPQLAVVQDAAVLGDDDVVVSYSEPAFPFGNTWSVVRWTGGAAVDITPASAPRYALAPLPSGGVVALGADTVDRWTSAGWELLGPAPAGSAALARKRDGGVIAHGAFTQVGGIIAARLAALRATCLPAATALGNGCRGQLDAATSPWLGATFAATGTGLLAPSIVLAATGLQPVAQGAVPLASIFAEALPGCDLLIWPDVGVEAIAFVGGEVSSRLELPALPFLAGLRVYHQLVAFELDAFGAVDAITATNALELTLGFF